MEKIANVNDIQNGNAFSFNYKGQQAFLVKTKHDRFVAYVAICPHEGEAVEWDVEIEKFICGCHLSLFNVEDGSLYRHSTLLKNVGNLTPIELKIDEYQDIYVV